MQPPPVENNNIINEVVEVEPQQRILDIECMIRKLDNEYIQELLPKQLALQNAITYLQQQEQELLQQQLARSNANEESYIGAPTPTSTATTTATTINMSLTKETIQHRQHSNQAPATTAATTTGRKRQLGLPKQHQQEMAAARLAQALFQMDSTDDEEEDDDSSKSNDSI